MTPAAQQPEHCETCEYKSMTGRDGSIQDCAVCDHTPSSDEKEWVKKMGCGKHSTRPHTPAQEERKLEEMQRAINLLTIQIDEEKRKARTATLKSRGDTLIEVIALLDTRTSAYTKVNLMLAKCRLEQRQPAGERK